MSTTEKCFSEQDVAAFVNTLKEWPNSDAGNTDQFLGVSPYTTLYFHYPKDEHLAYSLAMVEIHEEWEALVGKPYTIATHPDSERPHPYGSKRLPDLREFARTKSDDRGHFLFKFTDERNHVSSPTHAGYFWRMPTYDRPHGRCQGYSFIQLFYRWRWWLDNQEAWRTFLFRAIERLKAHQVYSGFAMALPLAFGCDYEVGAWERALADHFYGLDIDHPFWMSTQLADIENFPEEEMEPVKSNPVHPDDPLALNGHVWLSGGLRPTTWGVFVHRRWEPKLGISLEVLTDRLPAGVSHHRLSEGLWIELAPRPSLYPVEEVLPAAAVAVNALLKPVRNMRLRLHNLGQWDGDPNERFTLPDATRWLNRFDADSDWPSPEKRRPTLPQQPEILTALPGQPCPESGEWFAHQLPGKTVRVEKGQPMPGPEFSATGQVIWHLRREG